MTDKILEVRGLTKTYGGVKKKGAKQPTPTLDVLKGIDIDIYRGDGMAQMAALSVEAKSMAVKKFRAALHIAVFSFIRQAS